MTPPIARCGLALATWVLLASCSHELNTATWPRGPGFSRTAYRIPLQGSAVRTETRPCIHACRSRRTTDGYFACVAACPYVVVRPGPCRWNDRPPARMCIEQIADAGSRGPDGLDLAELMTRLAGPDFH